MPKFTDYTEKQIPEDNDSLMIYDAAAKVNKHVLFSGFWKWIAKKLKEATLSDLQTTDKTVIGALNELNGNSDKFIYVDAGQYEYGDGKFTYNTAAQDIVDNKLKNNYEAFFFVRFNCAGECKMIVQKYLNGNYASYILFGYGTSEIIYHVKRNGIWI